MKHPAWTPAGFDEWQRHYPATPFSRNAGPFDWTECFIDCWNRQQARLPTPTTVVLVAGLYSECLPGCHRDARRALGGAGYRVVTVPVRSSRAVMTQGEHIAAWLHKRLARDEAFIALTHSKGGIDTLAALVGDPALMNRCAGIALVQPPVGPSAIIDKLFSPPSAPMPLLERAARRFMRTRWTAQGTRDISSNRDPCVAAMLRAIPGELHLVHAVSWSIEPATRFDSHHTRLNGYRPDCAHDGQFYLEHQVLPGVPQICLPRLDHGQPVLGGLGFDAGRFWLALADLLHVTSAQTR
ncbi:hypothetical protein LMG28688_06921 [Paraburkholderia caffeinitolerans]|uniref:AB hydrolase-1 domain-containing protein n=1 Tax=Paraburkholderia caffeinitolerans TaxID=1723730 RepID=A0A6J5H1H8_9BURK|nr:hypothetical protein [Paraburkholderia caffeinitolerans]CAB3809098.1 hypothetical protein LMG28688_06921 [Paraburkholderia caffeinitolerans]